MTVCTATTVSRRGHSAGPLTPHRSLPSRAPAQAGVLADDGVAADAGPAHIAVLRAARGAALPAGAVQQWRPGQSGAPAAAAAAAANHLRDAAHLLLPDTARQSGQRAALRGPAGAARRPAAPAPAPAAGAHLRPVRGQAGPSGAPRATGRRPPGGGGRGDPDRTQRALLAAVDWSEAADRLLVNRWDRPEVGRLCSPCNAPLLLLVAVYLTLPCGAPIFLSVYRISFFYVFFALLIESPLNRMLHFII